LKAVAAFGIAEKLALVLAIVQSAPHAFGAALAFTAAGTCVEVDQFTEAGAPVTKAPPNMKYPAVTEIEADAPLLLAAVCADDEIKSVASHACPPAARNETVVEAVTTTFFEPLAAGIAPLHIPPVFPVLLKASCVNVTFAPVGS